MTTKKIFNKILITGQGRSGTSAIASIFYHLGYFMPDALRLSTFEDEGLRRLLAAGNINAVIEELQKRESVHNFLAWKDPKLFGLHGEKLAGKLDADWLYVFVFRDPLSIALRNQMSRGLGLDNELRMAVKYNIKLVDFYLEIKKTNKFPCYLISYEKFILDTEGELTKLLDYLGMFDGVDISELASNVLSHKSRYLNDVQG